MHWRLPITLIMLASTTMVSDVMAKQDDESLWFIPGSFIVGDRDLRSSRRSIGGGLDIDDVDWPEIININYVDLELGQRTIGLVELTTESKRPLILYCGGSAFRSTLSGGTFGLHLLLYGDVVLMDYPGYGRSSGSARKRFFVPAARKALAYARHKADKEDRRLVLWGMSLGGVVCPFAADAAEQVDLVVLETPTIRAASVKDPDKTPHVQIEALKEKTTRALVLAATQRDEPVSAFEALADGLRNVGIDTEVLVFDTAHGDVLFHESSYDRLSPYFATLVRDPEKQ